jgi:hypothetical protein
MSDKPFQEQYKFTQVHNYIFDRLMPVLSPNAFKVFMYIVRHTRGMTDEHGNRVKVVRLRYAAIKEGTGISGNITLSWALRELRHFDLITVDEGHEREANKYAINEDHESKSEIDLLTCKSEIDLLRRGKSKSEIDLQSKSEIDLPLKEKTAKERTTKKKTPANGTRAPSEHQAIIDVYVKELAYTPQNMGREARAAGWLNKHGYAPDQVLACYRHLKRDKFWRDKFVSLQKVADEITEFSRNGHAPAQTYRKPTQAEIDAAHSAPAIEV